ncbi:MAG: FG-GAP-like repeat-containing protein, partial [Sinobacteraceae bacterium]|nr:FG-GAP-like repeat-containing protein [Nevskiaceae bacterium]
MLLGAATTTQASNAVGSITGKFAVSPTGAATYSMPLMLPPGAGGMEPQLAITYNSQAPDTYMGPGFAVSGLSQIAVCPTTIIDDGYVGGVARCLDGQRLVSVASNQFRTKVDSFSQVLFDGTGYTVHTKAGITNTYGESSTTRFVNTASGQTLVWLLQRSVDTSGNYIDYHYTLPAAGSTGAYFPSEIDYGGNLNQGTPHSVAVKFVYQAQTGFRPYGQLYGQIVDWNQLLQEIDVVDLTTGKTLRSWAIVPRSIHAKSYPSTSSPVSSPDERPAPDAIQECATDSSGATQCSNSTEFAYTPPVGAQITASYSTGSFGGSGYTTAAGDFDGDGRADVFGYEVDSGGIAHGFVIRGSNPGVPYIWTATGLPTGGQFVVGDFNNDGLTDVAYLSGNGNNCNLSMWTWFSTGSYLSSPVQVQAYSGTACDANNSVHGLMTVFAGDFDGDGTTQLIVTWKLRNGDWYNGYSYVRLRPNFAQGSVKAETWGWLNPWSITSPQEVFASDITGDGIPDLMVLACDGSNNVLHITSVLGPNYSVVHNSSIPSQCINTHALEDTNGDGTPELIFLQQTGTSARVGVASADGMGGFFGLVSTPLTLPTSNGYQPVLADLNGDGYGDVAWVEMGTGTHHIVPMLSKGFQQFEIDPAYTAVSDNLNVGVVQGGDFDGDGLTEIALISVPGQSVRIAHFQGAQHLKVSQITNGYGAYVDLLYASQVSGGVYSDDGAGATFPVKLLHVPQYLVSQVRTENPGYADRTVNYHYSGARYHAQGLGFLGFSQVTASDATSGSVETTTYSQIFPFIGMPTSQVTKNGSLTLSNITTQYADLQPAPNSHFPYPLSSTAISYEISGSNPQVTSTQTTNTYNVNGELTNSVVTVTDAASGARFTTETTNSYDADISSQWILGRLTQTQVTRTDDTGNRITRTSTFTYAAGTGLLASEEVEPNDKNHWMLTEYTRDGFGNITSTTVSGPDIDTRASTNQFSSLWPYYGRFKTQACNALNQCTSYAYDTGTGNVTSSTDPNGVTTTYQYDVFGRAAGQIVNQNRSDGLNTSTTITRFWCTDLPSQCFGTPNAVWGEQTTTSAGLNLVVVYDATEREVLRAGMDGNGKWVLIRTTYDNLGRKLAVSTPYFQGATQIFWTTTQYDLLNRPTQIAAPIDESHPTGAITRYTYSGLSTTVTNPRGYATTKVFNALGRVVSVTDGNGSTVTYGYDPYDNLTRVTDSAGNVTTMTYDIRGHKTGMKDPDMGSWKYTPDTLGELLSQRDAKLQTISMQYDVLGRMISRTEKEDTTTWIYDSAWKGALYQVTITTKTLLGSVNTVYQRSYTYTPFGSPKTMYTSIDGTGYNFQYAYDNQGRVTQITYPSGFASAVRYNNHGAEDLIYQPGNPANYYWGAKDWDVFGKPYDEAYGNSVETTTYRDAAVGRVSAIMAGLGGSSTIVSTHYDWDANGNLTDRADYNRQGITDTAYYDRLDRLTEVATAGGGAPNATQYINYDALGNIQNKSDVGGYQYGALGAGPHAATTVNGTDYTYDGNGN